MTTHAIATSVEPRQEEALGIVKTYANWSIVPGLLPVPVLDIALLIGIQLKMVSQLSELYEVPFSKNATKSIISSLLGSIIPKVSFGCTGFFIKSIPLVGGALGILFMPAFAWAATYAIGRVFILHFESGGTLLDFDPAEVRDYFRQEFEQEYAKRKHEVGAAE